MIEPENKYINSVRELIKKNGTFDDVKYQGEYFGTHVYEPIFNDGERRLIGYPRYIVVEKSGRIHETTGDETWKLYRTINGINEQK